MNWKFLPPLLRFQCMNMGEWFWPSKEQFSWYGLHFGSIFCWKSINSVCLFLFSPESKITHIWRLFNPPRGGAYLQRYPPYYFAQLCNPNGKVDQVHLACRTYLWDPSESPNFVRFLMIPLEREEKRGEEEENHRKVGTRWVRHKLRRSSSFAFFCGGLLLLEYCWSLLLDNLQIFNI